MVKPRNQLKKLESRKKQWDSFPKSVQEATTRPGSEHK